MNKKNTEAKAVVIKGKVVAKTREFVSIQSRSMQIEVRKSDVQAPPYATIKVGEKCEVTLREDSIVKACLTPKDLLTAQPKDLGVDVVVPTVMGRCDCFCVC